jgi:hypothetical protein
MRKSEPALKARLADAAAAAIIGVIVYIGSHWYHIAEIGLISTALATGSGFLWAVSTNLPPRLRRVAARFNFSAACLATMSAICLLP